MGEAKRRDQYRADQGLPSRYAEAKQAEKNWGEDRTSHHLIVKKTPPPSLIRMREELMQPWNKDIYDAAIKEPTFETVLGTIAAKLDLALDGYYDVPDICEKLYVLLRDRVKNKMLQIPVHEALPEAVNAMMVENEDSFGLMEFDEAVEKLRAGIDPVKAGPPPYTVCNACITTLECCSERKCGLGKETIQLGHSAKTIEHLRRTVN